jgi:hypothetical protein
MAYAAVLCVKTPIKQKNVFADSAPIGSSTERVECSPHYVNSYKQLYPRQYYGSLDERAFSGKP